MEPPDEMLQIVWSGFRTPTEEEDRTMSEALTGPSPDFSSLRETSSFSFRTKRTSFRL